MSGIPRRRSISHRDPPRRSYLHKRDDFGLYKRRLESYYDEEQDYHFAEAIADDGMMDCKFQLLDDVELDTIDDMSSALNASQRKAVRWRITTLRLIGVFNVIALLGGCLPCWILMLRRNRESLLAEKRLSSCLEANFAQPACVYYRHELSTYTAFVGLWMFGTLFQSVFMIFTSWRLHNKSFQAVVSIWMCVFMVMGITVGIYTTTTLTLMSESSNWRFISDTFKVATFDTDLRSVLFQTLTAMLAMLCVLVLTQAIWLWIMRQVLQFGLNLQEFGSEICGDHIDAAAQENAHAAQSAIGRLLGEDEYSDYRRELEVDQHGDLEEEEGRGENVGNVNEEHNNSDNGNGNTPGIAAVMEMMATLTSTMSSLNQKIDAIEARVGDGTALLVMPPGESQWDARKPGQK